MLCLECGKIDDPSVQKVVAAVLDSMSVKKQNEVKAWAQEITACQHMEELVQERHPERVEQGTKGDCLLSRLVWL